MGGAGASASTVLADPIVEANQELAAAQAQPVPTEDEALQAEQHTAWAAYDFERCIVIFSRLLELHPDDAGYKEKLVTSYFNRASSSRPRGTSGGRRSSTTAPCPSTPATPAQGGRGLLAEGGRRRRRRLVLGDSSEGGSSPRRSGRMRLAAPAARPSPGGGRSR